jgi:predicted membrane-bound spermidine synthase
VGFLLLPQLSVFRPAIVTVLVVAMIVMVIMLLAKRVGRLPLLRRIKCLQSPLLLRWDHLARYGYRWH